MLSTYDACSRRVSRAVGARCSNGAGTRRRRLSGLYWRRSLCDGDGGGGRCKKLRPTAGTRVRTRASLGCGGGQVSGFAALATCVAGDRHRRGGSISLLASSARIMGGRSGGDCSRLHRGGTNDVIFAATARYITIVKISYVKRIRDRRTLLSLLYLHSSLSGGPYKLQCAHRQRDDRIFW